MSLTRFHALGCVIVSSLAFPAYAQPAWYAAGEAAYVVPDREVFRGSDVSLGAGVGLVLTEAVRLELSYQPLRLVPDRLPGLVEQHGAQIAGIYDYLRGERWQVYAGLGLGAARTEFGDRVETLPFASGSTGLSWAVVPSGRVRLDAEVRTRYTYDENEMLGRTGIRDSQFALRLRWHFGGGSSAAPAEGSAPATAPLAPASAPSPSPRLEPVSDRDQDGVADSRDYCPNTIPNVGVDADGCMTR